MTELAGTRGQLALKW